MLTSRQHLIIPLFWGFMFMYLKYFGIVNVNMIYEFGFIIGVP